MTVASAPPASAPGEARAPRAAVPPQRRRRPWWRPRLPFVTIAVQILALVLLLFWDRIFIIVPAGHAGVLWHRFSGTQIDRVYGEGLRVISPLDRMTVYEVRRQVVEVAFNVLTVDGLRLELDLAIRYRPVYDLLGMLQERIGPEYLQRVVIPQTESVLRKALGVATAEQIYTNADGLLIRAIVNAIEEAGRNFVELEDIIIRRIELPAVVRGAIEDKLTQQQLLESYRFRRQTAEREAERVRIEATGIRDYHRLVDETLSERLLIFRGITATREIAATANEKTVVIGRGAPGTSILIGTAGAPPTAMPPAAPSAAPSADAASRPPMAPGSASAPAAGAGADPAAAAGPVQPTGRTPSGAAVQPVNQTAGQTVHRNPAQYPAQTPTQTPTWQPGQMPAQTANGMSAPTPAWPPPQPAAAARMPAPAQPTSSAPAESVSPNALR